MTYAPEVDELISKAAIEERIAALGRTITQDYAGKELLLVWVLKGSFMFCADLARAIQLPVAIEFLGLKSYGDSQSSSGVVQITSDLSRPIEGKDVLIVEDIVDTGPHARVPAQESLHPRPALREGVRPPAQALARAREVHHRLSRIQRRRRVRGGLRSRLGRALPQLALRRLRATDLAGFQSWIAGFQNRIVDMSKRLALFDKLLAEGSKDPFHHYARALELRSLGRNDEALAAMVTCTESFPDYVASYLMAAQLAQASGDLSARQGARSERGRGCQAGRE